MRRAAPAGLVGTLALLGVLALGGTAAGATDTTAGSAGASVAGAVGSVPATAVHATAVHATAVHATKMPATAERHDPLTAVPDPTVPRTPPPGAVATVLDVVPRVLDVLGTVEELVVEVEQGTEVTVRSDVLFAFGSAELSAEARSQLDGVVAEIESASPTAVVVEGHTDGISSAEFNQTLSEQRAEAVRAYLAERVPQVPMTSVGYGFTRPVAEETGPGGEDDPAGRALNRRVAIILET